MDIVNNLKITSSNSLVNNNIGNKEIDKKNIIISKPLDKLDLEKINEKFNDLLNNIKEKLSKEIEEFKNTPTPRELNPSLLRGLTTAGLLSSIYLLSNPFLALVPLATTAISYKIGEKVNNPLYSIVSSFILPSVINSLILLYNSINPLSVISLLLTSSMISTVSLLNSTTSKEINDIKNFSIQTLPINYLVNIPLSVNLVSNFSSSISNIFEIDDNKKMIFSILTNLGLSALLALPFGVTNFALFAILSSIFSIINLKAAPKVQSFIDKAQNYLSNKISNFLKDKLSFLSKLPISLRSLIAGLTIGGVSSLSTSILSTLLMPILGPLSFAIPLATFLITGLSTTKSFYTMLKNKEKTIEFINNIESYIEKNEIDKAINEFKDYISKNTKELDLSKVSNDELKIIMFNQLINFHITNLILYYNDKKIDKAIQEFKTIQFLQLVLNTNDINKSKEIVNNISKDQALKAIEDFINYLKNNNTPTNN